MSTPQKPKTNHTKKELRIIIERSNNAYCAYAENASGIYGQGSTVNEARQNVLDGLALFKKYNNEKNIPPILKEPYEIVYRFDVQSFLNCYKSIFTNAALERLTGINQKQFQHYASGLKKPRAIQAKKIKHAIHNLAKELIAVEL